MIRIISLNLCLDRVLLDIGNAQVDCHKLSTGKSLCPKIPLAIISQINLSSSSSVTSQFLLPEMQRVSTTVHFLIFLSIALSNNMRKDDSGQLSIILLFANADGPGLKLSVFCYCKRPSCAWGVAKVCQALSSFTIKS